MSDTPDVSVIIVTANGAAHIEGCLTSLSRHMPPLTIEVIVSDNASTDGTPELVRAHFPGVTVLRGENVGYGAGNNRGIRVSRGRYVLVLNDDTIVPEGALARMVAFLDAHPGVGLLGPKLLNADGTLQPSITNHPAAWKDIVRLLLPERLQGNTPALRRLAGQLQRLSPRRHLGRYDAHLATQDVEGVKGACLLVRRDAIDQVGLFDEEIFLHTEESDWACRLRRAGWRIVFYPEVAIVHLGGQSFGPADSFVGRRFIQKHKSNLYFYEKHRGRSYAGAYRTGLGLALALRLLTSGVIGSVVGGEARRRLARKQETYATTLRVLWDRRFSRRNIYRDVVFKHL